MAPQDLFGESNNFLRSSFAKQDELIDGLKVGLQLQNKTVRLVYSYKTRLLVGLLLQNKTFGWFTVTKQDSQVGLQLQNKSLGWLTDTKQDFSLVTKQGFRLVHSNKRRL